MQIFVKSVQGQSGVYNISHEDQVCDLIDMINEREGIFIDQQKLAFQGKILNCEKNLFDAGLLEGSTVNSFIPLLGGGVISNTNMEPAFVALCQKYVYNKKICRECYATNSIKANTCRKRKCGRSGKLRLKKVAKK